MDLLVIIMLVYGVYISYAHIKMKKTGIIPKAILSTKLELSKQSKKDEYIEYTYKKGIVFGIIVTAFSAVILCQDYLPSYIPLAAEIALFVMIIIFATMLIKAQKKFLI